VRFRLAAVVAAVAIVATASAASPVAVSAHALLQASTPSSGSTLGSAPDEVTVTFTERPDLRLTTVKVLDSGGRDHVTGPPEALAEPPDSVRAPIGELGDGVYTVSWRTVSAVDGHVSAGSFAFGVGVAPPTGAPDAGAGAGQVGTPPAIVTRWLLYLGLVALLGVAFAATAVARRPAPDLLAMAAVGWLLAAFGTVGVVGTQWAETGAPIETLPSTSVGLSALARGVALALVGLAVAFLAVLRGGGVRRGWVAVGVTAALALGVDVATGHAAAGSGWLSQVLIQWLHALAAATWVGGLAALLVLLRTTPAGERLATARRFSTWAGVALVLVALTGVARAVGEIGTVEALVATDFGRVAIAKSALLVGLAGLGATNRYINLRNAERLMTGLRRIGSAEIVLAVAVLGLSALMVNLTPPASAGGPTQPIDRPIVAAGNDFGTSLRLRLIASPGAAGSNEFDVAVTDYDTSEPVEASGVELRFELASQAGVEASILRLEPTGPGRFRASGANLAIDGIWRINATVAAATGGVDVPLLAVTSVPPQPVQTLVSTDVPTLYNVQLGAPGFAQVYLDPGGPGPNELHVTFFDATGGAQPVPSVTIAARSEVAGDAILTPRLLEPGHFVASIDAATGPLEVDAMGPLPDGTGRVHLHVTIQVEP
jgi:copper transport protein